VDGGRAQGLARLGVSATIALAAVAGAGCDAAAAARGSCAAQEVSERRCRALVADAWRRLGSTGAPVVGAEVTMARPADRDTLRAQQLVATVRFSMLDGSARDVPVFCAPRLARTAVCGEPGG
jgi:hypothetical protein